MKVRLSSEQATEKHSELGDSRITLETDAANQPRIVWGEILFEPEGTNP
jgi:hypothetical protein